MMLSDCLKSGIAALSAAAILALSGCTPAGDAARAWQGTREQVGGVEVVRNPAAPLLRDGSASLRLLWSAPDPEAEARHGEWAQPMELAASHDRVFVLDRMASRVYIVDAGDGRVVGAFGRRGGGPGEIDRPYGVAFTGGAVVVGENGRGSLERFTADGQYQGSASIGRVSFALLPLPSGELYVSGMGGWMRVGADGAQTPLAWPEPVALSFHCERIGGGDGVLLRSDCSRPAFQMVGTDGTHVREVDVAMSPRAPDPELLEAHLVNVRNTLAGMPAELVEEQIRSQRERMATVPAFRAAQQDAEGRILVWDQAPVDLDENAFATLHIFAPAGEYLATLPLQESWAAYAARHGVLYALVRAPVTGLISLKAYRLEMD
jgi:hypothetical protein